MQQLGGSLNFSSIPAPVSSVGPVNIPSSQAAVSQFPIMPQGGSLSFGVTPSPLAPSQGSLLPAMPQGGSLTFPVTPAPMSMNGVTGTPLQGNALGGVLPSS